MGPSAGPTARAPVDGAAPAGGPAAPDRGAAARRPLRLRGLPAHWPITLAIAGFPVWWALGASAFIWPVLAAPLAVRLVTRRRPIRVPMGFGLWLVFLALVVLSAASLDGSVPFAYLWRLANYASATVFFLAVVSATEEEMPTDRLVGLLAGFWILVVAGGWLGTLLPDGELPSATEALLPSSLATNEFFQVLVRPSFSQVQEVLGYPLGRPKAPFTYTNDWGSAYALLLPFFFLSWLQARDPRRRSTAYVLLAASLIPVFVSLNRGMWLSLGVALVYAASRSGEVARMARRALLALVVVGLLVLAFTPVRGIVEGRAANDHSSAGRGLLYSESFRIAADSPVIGLGGPQPYEGVGRIIPNVGTQGLFWMVLVSTGYLGAAVFVGSWLRLVWETRAGPPVTFWAHVTLVVAVVQLVVYDIIPASLHIIFLVAAIGVRAAWQAADEARGATAPTGAQP